MGKSKIKPREPKSQPRRPGRIDYGIARAVKILQAGGVETFESCEGGKGHAFPEPTVRFHGTNAAGWHALSVCFDFGLPVFGLRRVWDLLDGDVTGPYWEIVFRRRIDPEEYRKASTRGASL